MAAIRVAASGTAATSGWYFLASRRYAAWMTSGSASGSTWSVLYGSSLTSPLALEPRPDD